jgi:hypothetical protein
MRTVWDEGATADLRVEIDGAGQNTQVEVVLHDPDGAETSPQASPNTDRDEWTVMPVLDAPGVWWLVAEVTGAGAGVKRYRLRVRPSGPVEPTGRVYATSGDLARYLQDAPPVDADRVLARASELVEDLAVAAVYAVDDEGYPTHEGTRAALRDATVAQAAFMAAGRGSEYGTGGDYNQVSIGSVSLAGRGEATTGPVSADGIPIAPGALGALRRYALAPGHPWVNG